MFPRRSGDFRTSQLRHLPEFTYFGASKTAVMRTPMLRYSLLLLLLGAVNSLSAQPEATRSGYYLTRDGEKVEGFFPEKISQRNLVNVWFAETAGGEPEKVPLSTIREIFINETEQYLIYELSTTERTEQITFRKVVDGPISLYRGNSSIRGAGLYLLEDRADLNLLVDHHNFEGVVQTIFSRCPAMREQQYRYNQNSLAELTIDYNRCRDDGGAATVLEEAAPARFRIGLRPYWYDTNLEVPGSNYYADGEYESESGVSAALSLAWIATPRLQVLLELSYLQVISRSSYVNVIPRDEPDTYSEVTFDMRYLELPILVQYGFPMGRLRPFVEGGLYLGFPLSRELEDNLIVADPSHIQFQPSHSFSEPNFGYTIGAGLGWTLSRKLELEVLGRWTQASSQMRTERDVGGLPELNFTNLRTDKIEVGVRIWWGG